MNKVLKILLSVIGIVIGLFILMTAIMGIFNLCPPDGYVAPPWCSSSNIDDNSTNNSQAQLDVNNTINSDVNNSNYSNDINKPNDINYPNDDSNTEKIIPIKNKDYNLYVTVPYWTNSDVYLSVDNNSEYLKLNKINNTLYSGSFSLKPNTTYYFSQDNTKSLSTYKTTENTTILNAVVDWKNSNKKIIKKGFQKGITFGGMLWDRDYLKPSIIEYNLDIVKSLGADYIVLITDWFVYPDIYSNNILPWYDSNGPFPNKSHWVTATLSDSNIDFIINEARKRNIKVVLKPHIDPIMYSPEHPKGRGDIQPTDWSKWYDSYTNFIMHYARLAQKDNVALFVIGTEIDPATMEGHSYGPKNGGQTAYFDNLIDTIRKTYKGKLAYSASCYGECWSPRGVKFWDKLDYIGFEPYMSLSNKNNPSIEEIRTNFNNELEFARKLHEQYNKPILFTELAALSYTGSAKYMLGTPADAKVNLTEQSNIYEAIFQDIENIDWIVGMYPWALYLVKPNDDLKWGFSDLSGGFIGKPAGEVIRKWYLKINN